MSVGDDGTPDTIGHKIGFARQPDGRIFAVCVGGHGFVRRRSAGKRRKFRVVEADRLWREKDQIAGIVGALRRPIDKHRVEHPRQTILRSRADRDRGCLATLAVEGAEIDQQSLRPRDKGADLLTRQRHRRHASRGQQHIGGKILRDGVGDAMNPGHAAAQTRQDGGGRLRRVVACGSVRVVHLISLRRHNPDQVRWVSPDGLSARRRPDTPRDCCQIPSPQVPRRQV